MGVRISLAPASRDSRSSSGSSSGGIDTFRHQHFSFDGRDAIKHHALLHRVQQLGLIAYEPLARSHCKPTLPTHTYTPPPPRMFVNTTDKLYVCAQCDEVQGHGTLWRKLFEFVPSVQLQLFDGDGGRGWGVLTSLDCACQRRKRHGDLCVYLPSLTFFPSVPLSSSFSSSPSPSFSV